MTTTMIDQQTGAVHTSGRDPSRHTMSSVFGSALDNTGRMGWLGGRLAVVPESRRDKVDRPALEKMAAEAARAEFLDDMLTSLDLEVPAARRVLAALEGGLLPISLDAPAFTMPLQAHRDCLAVCLAAARIAWEIRDGLITPVGVDPAEVLDSLSRVFPVAVALGGIDVYTRAKGLLGSPGFWERCADSPAGKDFDADVD